MATAGTTVTVACKLPNGLILRVGKFVDRKVPVMGGGVETVSEWRQTSSMVEIKGNAREIGADPKAPIIGGYALTHGVDAEFWAQWLKDNAEHAAVQNKLIFAHEKTDSASGISREYEKKRSGMEPIVGTTDPRFEANIKLEKMG